MVIKTKEQQGDNKKGKKGDKKKENGSGSFDG